MAQLMFFRGEEMLFEYRLAAGRMSIGRADSCDVALPGEAISRTHCFVSMSDGEVEVIDRSRHGITVDGRAVRRAPLKDGSELGIGGFRVVLRTGTSTPLATSEVISDRVHERVMDADNGAVIVERTVLRVESGPDEGSRKVLKKSRVSVGRGQSDVRFSDPSITEEHCFLRVSLGRVMVEPGRGAVYIDGARVRSITPLYADETLRLGSNVLRIERSLDEEVPFAKTFGAMVGESHCMLSAFGVLRRMAAHHYPVLIMGESGTGKELAARGIHDHSVRSGAGFVAVNCGAIQGELFESELFGHEQGAFTDAKGRKDGAFHAADGGTLFLDEIGELPLNAQVKLLRCLESGEVRRVGSNEVEYPDVRVLAATNRDLSREVREGRFREDLFFRLNVLSVELPPLRARRGDLEILGRIITQGLHPEAHITEDALKLLQSHKWPGNVRELRNVLTRAYVMGGARIGPRELVFHALEGGEGAASPLPDKGTLKDAERDFIQATLDRHGGNRSAAARELGVARSTLHYKMSKLRIS